MCCCVRPLGLKPEDAVRAAEQFHGTGRRFEIKGECNGAVIVDDYAHHPTELAATLATAKEMGYDRVIAVHQPFTYSRTKMLMDDFAKVLRAADQVVLLPIMAAARRTMAASGARIWPPSCPAVSWWTASRVPPPGSGRTPKRATSSSA